MSERVEELNYLLYLIHLVDGRLSGVWKYGARILISSIVRRTLIDEIGFQVIIQKGVEEGFLSVENNEIKLTANGNVHLNYTVNNLRFRDELKFQILRLRDLIEESRRINYIKSLENELTDALQYSQNRKTSPPLEKILVNGFISEVKGKLKTFSLTSNAYLQTSNFEAKKLLIQNIVYFLRDKGNFCVERLGYDKVTLFTTQSTDSETVAFIQQNRLEFKDQVKETSFEDLSNSEFEYLIAQILETHLASRKMVKIGQELRFIDFSRAQIDKITVGQSSVPLTLFYGFNVKVKRIKNSKYVLWLDPTHMQFYTIDKWIEARGLESSEEIIKTVSTVDVLPRKRTARLVKVDINAVIPSSIKDIWKTKYNYMVIANKGMAQVTFDDNRVYDYPLETLSLEKKWIEQNIGFLMIESSAISPDQRFKETQDLFNKYFKSPIDFNFAQMTFNNKMANLTQLGDVFKSCYELLPPIVVFSKSDITKRDTDTRSIFKFGGYAGNQHISIFRIVCPPSITDHDCYEFLQALKRTYDTIFGTLDYELKDIRMTYPDTVLRESFPKIEETTKRKLQTISAPKRDSITPIAIVVVPNQNDIFYFISKGIINDIWRIPDQHIKVRTFDRILRRDLPLMRGFVLQLYLKSLKSDEPPWILRYPSDSLGTTVYCGIGFSMQVRDSNLRKSIGVLAICDAQGKLTYQKHLALGKVTNYISEEMLQKIFAFINQKAPQASFERLAIYKKGHLKEEEKLVFMDYLKKIRQTEYWSNKQIDVISVEEDISRMFEIRDNSIVNVNSGLVAEFSDKDALICVSGHPETGLRHGTARLMHLRSEISESKKTISELAREYYDRTFLNWMAPVTLSKLTPELNISQNMAEIAKEVDIVQEFTYLLV